MAGYIAKYALKHYTRGARGLVDTDGVWKPAPFLRMSKGVGKDWLEQYATDLSHGYLIQNGRKHALPRYYKQKLRDAVQSRLRDIRTSSTTGENQEPN